MSNEWKGTPGRRARSDNELPAMTPERLAHMLDHQPVEATRFTWLAVHGALCLALRHPQNTGPSRQVQLEFATRLGRLFVEWEMLTEEELASVARTEAEESPHGE